MRFFFLTLFFFYFSACMQETTIVMDSKTFSPKTQSIKQLSPSSNEGIVAIHRNILKPNCAVSGCHDGHFEPDFRSVQSAYATLVYHPIIKNNAAKTFQYRVVPFESQNSVLHERITNCNFAGPNDCMPQLIPGETLSPQDVATIKNWIDDGAKDIFGKVPQLTK